MPLEGLSGRKALVSGATSGIGAAIVGKLKREGVEVVATDVVPGDGILVADLTRTDEIESLAGKAGTPDFLVNVAGGPVPPQRGLPRESLLLENVDEASWHWVLAANLTTAFLMCREFAPRMKARGFGRIVNFASIATRRGSDRVGVHYAAAKGGIVGLTKTLALELGPHGVTVNAIAPGFIKTPKIEAAGWGGATPAFIESLPLRRAGKPEDIAGTVAMLCSQAGGYVSGATLDVNGGWYFGP